MYRLLPSALEKVIHNAAKHFTCSPIPYSSNRLTGAQSCGRISSCIAPGVNRSPGTLRLPHAKAGQKSGLDGGGSVQAAIGTTQPFTLNNIRQVVTSRNRIR